MYHVNIKQDGDDAVLECETLEEANSVRRSFINYGKCQSVTIVEHRTDMFGTPVSPENIHGMN